MRTNEMPAEKYSEIIEGFKNIKQKVLFKIDGDIPENLPENVLARRWLPLSDLFAHVKVVAFVTHGKIPVRFMLKFNCNRVF